jgi:hypothetical protein
MPKRRRSPSLPPYLDGGALPPLRWPERRRPSPVAAQAEAPSLPAGFGDAEPNGGGSRGGWHESVGAALHLAVALILRGYRRGVVLVLVAVDEEDAIGDTSAAVEDPVLGSLLSKVWGT